MNGSFTHAKDILSKTEKAAKPTKLIVVHS